MSFWQRLLRTLGFKTPTPRTYNLDEDLLCSLQALAEQEQRSETDLAAELLADAFARRAARDDAALRWRSLSPREQQIAALVCRGYTNSQIAAQLVISMPTVKTHVHHVLEKFDVRNRDELRQVLAEFDFDGW
jgi:DNA-binding NarL/FixJ family response regulator